MREEQCRPHGAEGAPDALVVHPADNVATATRPLKAGELVCVVVGERRMTVRATEDIPFAHKIAVQRIARGAEVRKYGEVIGLAARDIARGALVHVHNVVSLRARPEMLQSGDGEEV